MKYKKIILSLMLLIILVLLALIILRIFEFGVKEEVKIDFSKEMGQIGIIYGVNENSNWVRFVNSPEIHNYHKNIDSEYIRVWVSSQWYKESTVPLYDDGTYDFNNLDRFINTVLKIDAIPFVLFAHAPGTYGEGHGEPPPKNDDLFADYVETVVKHYADACENNLLVKPCDVNEWYFEIWNEPYTDVWWEDEIPRYVTMYNKVYPRIKSIAQNAKVGGFGTWFIEGENNEELRKFLENSQMDFISIHHYGNILNKYASERKKMKHVKIVAHDSVIALRDFINLYKPNENVEIIQGEYNSDYRSSYMPHLDEQFTAAWYASSLIWEIKSKEVDIEMFYSGTSLHEDKGFGMWSNSLDLWPVYYMKKSFVKYNKKGSSILETTPTNNLDILAIENADGRFITIVNKRNKANSINLMFINGNFRKLVDLHNNNAYLVLNSTAELILQPYEVKFLQVI